MPETPARRLPLASDVHRRRGETRSSPAVALTFRPASVWDGLRMRVLGHDVLAEYRQQLANLNTAIQQYPAASVNYLRRGEFYRAQGEHIRARADFKAALQRARAELDDARWGLVAQTVRDRAVYLLSRMEDA